MAIETRSKGKLPSPGPFLAEITNHLDPSYMGSIEVVLTQGITNLSNDQRGTYAVKYMSPFYGVTSVRHQGNDASSFNDVQKSYGMWMVPPDVGTTVMVIFIDGDPNQGFWIGCVQDMFQNHMVPGLAASTSAAVSAGQQSKYGTSFLPVAEYNKKTNKVVGTSPDKIAKPVHPFAERLLQQGLLLDTIRGVTSSSARREVPSAVFGISTPGPLDTSGPYAKIGYKGERNAPVSRLGGSTFVMDDGDVNGDNELIRLRTRTGHQILMHNTKDLVYIANAQGTAWIELTGNGKIDIYAADSVSIHTENDFNFKADRDINLEAGRAVNIKAGSDFHLDATGNFILNVDQSGIITLGSNLELSATGNNNFTAGGNTNILSGGDHKESAANIHMNGPAASAAAPADTLKTNSVSGGIVSIMTRVPMHEPWADHESTSPSSFTAEATDPQSTSNATKTVSVSYNKVPATKGEPPAPTGNVEDDNLAAFLWMIRACEGTTGVDGYRTMFTGALFTVDDPNLPTYKYADHPRKSNVGGGITSTAAGAYQFLSKTWDSCKKSTGVTDFSPASQDKGCIYLIQMRSALNDVKSGNFTSAVNKCKTIWASLPGSPYGQNPKNFDVALNLYKKAGGTFVA